MKNFRLVIGVVVILAVVCSPALAISSSDLIAQYQYYSTELVETLEFDEDTPLGPYAPPYPWYLTPVIPIPAIEPADPLNSLSFADTPLCCDPTIFEQYRVPIPTTIPTPVTQSSYVMPGVMPTSDDSDPVTIRWDPRIAISLDEITPRPNYTVIHGITIPWPNTRGL